MELKLMRYATCGALLAGLAACGGGGGTASSSPPPTSQSASVPMMVSDASSDDWATVGVKVLSIGLIPQGGGSNVTVYTAPSPAPYINLEQLDQLAEILGNISVPVGTYTGAVITVGGNPGDVLLTTAADPEAGFIGAPATAIASNQIQIQGTQGTTPNLTVPVTVNFASPLTVSSGQNDALDLEFDLSHPAFIVGHQPPSSGTVLWAVDFNGPVRHLPIHDLTRLVLRHLYGTVSAVASDNSSITVTKDLPTLPPANPETAVSTMQSLTIDVDSTNGTLYYDVDAQTSSTITSFSSLASSLPNKYVRIAARYQENGTLVATRIWASTQFNDVWISPEGHILHVNTTSDVITVTNEMGVGVPLTINANTEFYFRQPANAVADATPIGTGTSFLTSQNLVRGFKVHASVVDPLATPLVAQSIDIESAAYSGPISNANNTSFEYTHNYPHAADDYAYTLDYIASSSANGTDANGNAITGFKWWNFAYPTVVDSGSGAVNDFVTATTGSVNFGGSVGAVIATGISYGTWGDMANPTSWSAPFTILLPTAMPLGAVTAAFASDSFAMTVLGGGTPATVDVSSAAGSATLVYQVDRANGILTVSSIDIASASGMAALTSALVLGTPVKVYGIPQPRGTLKAYVLIYYTGMAPTA